MTISEKVAYIKGLADNAGFDSNNEKDKVLKAIIDVLEDIAASIGEINEQLDAVDEDLANLEEDFYEDDEYDDEFDDDDDFCYEVECPACHDVIYLDDEMIDEGGINCPNCGQELEFDFSCDECGGCSEEE
jgi:formylmethanofuran dehydrogenase subunit E